MCSPTLQGIPSPDAIPAPPFQALIGMELESELVLVLSELAVHSDQSQLAKVTTAPSVCQTAPTQSAEEDGSKPANCLLSFKKKMLYFPDQRRMFLIYMCIYVRPYVCQHFVNLTFGIHSKTALLFGSGLDLYKQVCLVSTVLYQITVSSFCLNLMASQKLEIIKFLHVLPIRRKAVISFDGYYGNSEKSRRINNQSLHIPSQILKPINCCTPNLKEIHLLS